MLSISSLSSGRKPLKLEHFLWYDFCVFWSWNCSLIFSILFRKKYVNLSGRSDGDSVNGIGFSSSNFVSNLRILYRFLALFSLSFNLLNLCVFLECCRCFLYIELISLYSSRSLCCLDLIHFFSAILLCVLKFCASLSNWGCGLSLFLPWFSMVQVHLLSFYGIPVIIVILLECFFYVYIKVVFQVTDEAFLIDFD